MNKRNLLKVVFAFGLLVCALGPVKNNAAAASSRYFPETGKTVKDPFLAYWTTHGGLTQQGFPITDAYDEKNDADGKTYLTQYFERARFEYHPENNDPKFQVLLGLLGKEAITSKYGIETPDTAKKVVPGTGTRTFPETGKTVSGLFLSYWQSHGGLEQQGFPITNAYEELNDADGQTYITQYFERARFEYHPENNDPKFQVLLGLVGQEIYSGKAGGNNGTGGNSTPPPPPPWSGMHIATPVDTAFIMPSSNPATSTAYFVSGGLVSWLDLKTSQHSDEKNPTPAQTIFRGLAFPQLTSVIAWTEGDPYYGTLALFNGPVYSLFSINAAQVIGAQPPNPQLGVPWIPGPIYPIYSLWDDIDGISREKGFDTATSWPGIIGQVYVFQGSGVDLYDSKEHEFVFGRGGSITTIFPGLPFEKDIDAVVPWPNGKVYFFKGDQYAVWDIAKSAADPGYPRLIN